MSRPLRAALSAALLTGTLYVGARPAGPLPALGPLLDPAAGLWSAARGATSVAGDATVSIPGLGGHVRVVYDQRAVPHIFADREEDAYRALGYVDAREHRPGNGPRRCGVEGWSRRGERALSRRRADRRADSAERRRSAALRFRATPTARRTRFGSCNGCRARARIVSDARRRAPR